MQKFYDNSRKIDILPDSFYECVHDCKIEAVHNNFFYQNYFKP